MDAREKVAVLSILVNTGLAVFKFALGTVSGSVAIMADGIHSTSDIVASIAVLLGLRLSQRKSKNFPYGLYKVENIIAIVSAMAIFFAGYEIVKEVVFQSGHAPITHIPAAMIGVCVTIGVGIQSAQLLANKDVHVVLTGNCGPNAFATLQAAGIEVCIGVSGTIRAAIEQYKSGQLHAAAQPNVGGHFGSGGMGGGRGQGSRGGR